MTDPSPTYAIVAGGGTAGHVTPGVAIANALVARGHDPASIHFVGAARGVEVDVVPAAGFELTVLPGRGIRRAIALDNVGAVVGIVRAVFSSIGLLRRLRPRVVVATGGFASVPCSVAAVALRIPIVVAEQNAVPGLANRLSGRFARACAVSFEGTRLPRAVVTGNPVRADILAVDRSTDRAAARARLGLPDGASLVLAFGGSLGALRINRAILGLVAERRGTYRIRHLIGRRDWESLAPEIEAASQDRRYVAVDYEHDMATALVAADVAVCRAGASTIAELAAIGVPAVLIPYPGATGDHQTANAEVLVRAGAGVLVADGDVDADRLGAAIDELIGDPGRLEEMGRAARSVGRRDAAERVADLVEASAS